MSHDQPFVRPHRHTLDERLAEPRRHIQVVLGARQVGKSTLVRQVLAESRIPHVYANADLAAVETHEWITARWLDARKLLPGADGAGVVLALDEAHTIPNWSLAVKQHWDEDTWDGAPLKVLLLGSSPLLMRKGLSDLAGRFETVRLPHWSFREMRDAFGLTADQYIFFGGYPEGATHMGDIGRWHKYVWDSLVETTISRDISLLTRVDKPAMLRRLLETGCLHSGQILSLTKLLGALRERGNTTTMAHYLDLLAGAGLLTGLQKHYKAKPRMRSSIPKLQVFNNALASAPHKLTFEDARSNPNLWGRLTESAVGAHLANAAFEMDCEVSYWRENNREVDFVVRRSGKLLGIEVKSGRVSHAHPGLDAFTKEHNGAGALVVGGHGVKVEDFLASRIGDWF